MDKNGMDGRTAGDDEPLVAVVPDVELTTADQSDEHEAVLYRYAINGHDREQSHMCLRDGQE
ncbi:hypothetical protein P3T76_011213 [Phytophthora citrophthora]|uniref:Uncharacterized protein n=1 Tax=Phytophthora citrophthora TaxID=4793 RepID=A0AAD9GA44_9STRA|nr:hypothetical protein P3T76_011213 [Phytophthora citrophthora]